MGRRHWNSRFDLKKSFQVSWILWAIIFNVCLWKIIESIIRQNILQLLVFNALMCAVIICALLLKAKWRFYNED